MNAETGKGDVYRLRGPNLAVTYRRGEGTLDLESDDHILSKTGLDAAETCDPETGLRVTATVLESDRSGRRYTLTLLLPDVSWGSEAGGEAEVTGVAIVSKNFEHAVGGPPPALQSFDDVKSLEGTVSRST